MDFKTGSHFHGFKVERIREDKKAGGELVEMTHVKTGARLCYSKNKEENKLFSVAFKTIPDDSTGVFHILEHSVLCGSDKYPVKEPFVELLKSSMNTFLNAMTYPDKTVYPVSSRNNKDYLNLAEVYLDAVFAPNLLKNPNIFYQEGRHLETGDEVAFNGVVLNEMRGAMSEADDRLEEALGALLFPDNCYRFNSGGDPYEIPKLTYEKFVAMYRRFYHPSNAYFYLDGDIPEEETFALIESYLERFDRTYPDFDVLPQTPKSADAVDYYATDDAEASRDMIAFAKIFADFTQVEKIFAVSVLADYLASTNESPLKRAVLSSKLAEDLEVGVCDGIRQPYVSVVARNMSDSDAGKIKSIITDTLKTIAENGIPKEDLTASLNKFEFSFRQMPEPKGLFRNVIALDSWLYGGDPMLYLDTDSVFESLREMAKGDGFEKLLREVFLDEEGEVTLHLKASTTFAAEVSRHEAEYAKSVYDGMSDAERDAHAKMLDEFNEWQKAPDTEEGIATIPVLPISEVSDEPTKYNTEVFESNGVKTMYHKIATNGIVYFSLYAPLTQLNLDELSLISVLPSLLGQLPTSMHDVVSLQREIKTYLGDFSASCQAFAKYGQTKTCVPYLVVSASALEENFERAEAIVAEILTETRFDEPSRIHEIVKQIEDANRQRIVAAGQRTASCAAKAGLSSEGAASEALGGVSMILKVKDLNKNFDAKYDDAAKLFERVCAESLTKENLTLGVTAEEELSPDLLTDVFSNGDALPENVSYKSGIAPKTAIKVPSQVSFAVSADLLEACGMENDGAFRVAANVLSLSYLWNMVRVRGGAYGTGLSVAGNGTMICYSYRDPSPSSSLAAYAGAADFIEEFAKSGEVLDKYIISAVSSGDPLQTPRAEGLTADALYLSGLSDDQRRKTRGEMLRANAESFTRFARALRHMATDGRVCVVGGSAVDDCEGLERIEI